MRFVVLSGLAATALAAASLPARCADMPGPFVQGSPYPPRPLRYEQLWAEQDVGVVVAHRGRRPPTRVMGGPGYVGSDYGLGKPAFSGVGPRPDWGRSSVD